MQSLTLLNLMVLNSIVPAVEGVRTVLATNTNCAVFGDGEALVQKTTFQLLGI